MRQPRSKKRRIRKKYDKKRAAFMWAVFQQVSHMFEKRVGLVDRILGPPPKAPSPRFIGGFYKFSDQFNKINDRLRKASRVSS